MTKSIVGDLIGRKNVVYAPTNRAGVLLLFARLVDEFDMLVEETADDSSYVVVRRRVDEGWERVKVYLAYRSSGFTDGDLEDGSLLICWHHDWPECPLKAFELKALFESGNSISQPDNRPGRQDDNSPNPTRSVGFSNIMPEDSRDLLSNRSATQKRFEKAIGDLDEKIKNFFPDKT